MKIKTIKLQHNTEYQFELGGKNYVVTAPMTWDENQAEWAVKQAVKQLEISGAGSFSTTETQESYSQYLIVYEEMKNK